MNENKAVLQNAWPYQKDLLNLPVENLEAAIPFYETVMGFRVVSRNDTPHPSATLSRDAVQIGLAQNGGDPTQDGCFFDVDDVEKAYAELKENGLQKDQPEFGSQTYGTTRWKVFFVVAPDGLCYCFGERQN
jgi:lactoylglutathione lyase